MKYYRRENIFSPYNFVQLSPVLSSSHFPALLLMGKERASSWTWAISENEEWKKSLAPLKISNFDFWQVLDFLTSNYQPKPIRCA